MKKAGPMLLPLLGLTADRLAGGQAGGQLAGRPAGFFSTKAYFKVCIEAQKIQ